MKNFFYLGSFNKVFSFLLLFLSFSIQANCEFHSLSDLVPSVVLLKRDFIETTSIGTQSVELWFRVPDRGVFVPKMASSFGTGFFVHSPAALFLVTAAHVAHCMGSGTKVILGYENQPSVEMDLSELIATSTPAWKVHPIEDLAVLRLCPTKEVQDGILKRRFIPLASINKELSAPPRDSGITILGFPLGYGTQDKFSPLTKQTHPSSSLLRMDRFDTKTPGTFFLCEDPSIGGFSGGPAFDISIYKMGSVTMAGSGTKLFGVVHGTVGDNTGGKMAAIVPSHFIFDLIPE